MNMKTKIYIIGLLLSFALVSVQGQDRFDLSQIDHILPDDQKKCDAAFVVADAVEKSGAYIETLSDLFADGIVPLPVGIKKGGYELIIQRVEYGADHPNPKIYATCAFKFKDTGQKVAFEGEAVLTGKYGVETQGKLSLIAPVRRDIGKQSTLVVREGTSVSFDCNGIQEFDAKMLWVVTSEMIIPVDAQGNATGGQLQVPFEMHGTDFDNYVASLNINQSFMFKGLKDIVFTLKGATLDQSDTETSSMIKFPTDYLYQAGSDYMNMWRGIAVSEASVTLPSAFKKPGGSERITIQLKEVLFDENGFSGTGSATNIMDNAALNPLAFDLSLNDFSLGLFKNSISFLSFDGYVNIPPLGTNSLVHYTGAFNPLLDEYELKAKLTGPSDFPLFGAGTITFNDLTTVSIALKNGGVYPTIDASGVLTVKAPLGGADAPVGLTIPDINFENLIISRESPYVQIGSISTTGPAQARLAAFELEISDIHDFKIPTGIGLLFETKVALSDQFGADANIRLHGDCEHWKFDKVEVEKAHVDFKSGAYSIVGDVIFKNGDPVYGDGFSGKVKLSLVDKFEFDAVAVFGKKDDYKYFLADVFYEMSPPQGILVPPVLNFYGFGGGLYRRMQQSSKAPATAQAGADLDFAKSLSGINYLPDKNVGLGMMASTKFALKASSNAFNAKVGFEMQFNRNGGLNFVQFRGDAAFMQSPDAWGKLSDNIAAKIKEVERNANSGAAKVNLSNQIPENKNSGFLTASILIEYDNINKTFSADLNTYLNAGVIKGAGAGDRLGGASAYFAPDTWHTYMGTPSNRLGVKVLGLAELNGYFMLGDGIPALPPPPQRVLKNLSGDKQAKLARSSADKLGAGKGIAFGAAFDVNFDASLAAFYAHFGLGLGAEFMLTNLNGATCAGISGTPGINGWFAQAQAWAYAEADIGLQVRVFGRNRRFSILDISAGTLLEGKGPNPMYFAGAVGGRFSVLGGLVKGNCSFDFEIGEKCKLVGGSPFGEEIIAELSPGTGAKDVNVFAAPQAIFNIPVGVSMTIDEEDGSKGTYMVTLEDFYIKNIANGATISGAKTVSSDGTVSVLTPDEPFESQKDVEVYAKVSFKKQAGSGWDYVKGDDGKPVFEEKKATFHTGDRPKEILPEHVKYSYPIDRQYNFYANEYKNGYLLVTQNYRYLFEEEKPEGFDQKIRISDSNGKSVEKPFTYTTSSSGDGIKFAIDFSLDGIAFDKNKIYKLAVVNIPTAAKADVKSNIAATTTAAEGIAGVDVTHQKATEVLAQLSEKEIYALNFKSSQYATFNDKIKAFDKASEGWRDPVLLEPFVHHIKTNLRESELFDSYEIQGINTHKLVRFAAQVNQTEWYNQSFYRGMYQSQTYVTPPVQKVEIQTGTDDKVLTDDEMNMSWASGYNNTQGVFRYALPYWCARDFFAVKSNIAQRVYQGRQVTQQEANVMNTDFPPVVLKGNYPVNVSYVLPGKEITTSTVGMTMYNPVTP
ncbi:hypothetical protein SAMD00024442_7_68 [Candidatus Symbiothrix dinenymphae]|nr:hypothetical protein SAMD00024442_7_68 [Candidatus Symbiothrix dinenymphae]